MMGAQDRDERLVRMRSDYALIASALRRDGWTEQELAEWDASLRAAAAGEEGRIQAAADHLAALAAPIRAMNERIRAAEANLRQPGKGPPS